MRIGRVLSLALLPGILLSACNADTTAPKSGIAPPADLERIVVTPSGGWFIKETALNAPARCPLGSAGNASSGQAFDVDVTGRVVGWMCGRDPTAPPNYPYGTPHAFVWRPAVGMKDLTPSGGRASGMNDNGWVVGDFGLWIGGVGFVNPGIGSPTEVNNAGVVIGGRYQWSMAGGIVDLSPMVEANDINEAGDIIGGAVFAPGQPMHAVERFADGTIVDYGTLGGGITAVARGQSDLVFARSPGSTVWNGPSAVRSYMFDLIQWYPVPGLGGPAVAVLGGTDAVLGGTDEGVAVGWSEVITPGTNISYEAFVYSLSLGSVRLHVTGHCVTSGSAATAVRRLPNKTLLIAGYVQECGGFRPVLWTMTPM